jgi:HEAT repeat protein
MKVPDTCAPAVAKVLEAKDTIAQKNALYVASEVRMPTLEPVLFKLLKKKKDRRWISRILRALYRSGTKRACKVVSKYAKHPYEYVRMRALMLVGKHGCKEYKSLLWEGLNDPYFMVRDAARDGLVKNGFSADEVIESLGKVRKIELLKLLNEKCPDRSILFKVKPSDPFERYWYGKVKCK